MLRQFTATVYIVENERVLLIFHKKLQKWLPAGGHLDPNELPHEAAKREALEETGIEVELNLQENIWIERWNASSIPRPYMCLLEEIPAHGDQAAHQHVDFVYIGKPIGGSEVENHEETDGLKWFSADEIEALESDVVIFEETKRVIKKILLESCPIPW